MHPDRDPGRNRDGMRAGRGAPGARKAASRPGDGTGDGGLPWVIRTTFAAGLVLAILIFAGLVLNLTTGLTTASWAIAAGLLAVATATAFAVRSRRARRHQSWAGHPVTRQSGTGHPDRAAQPGPKRSRAWWSQALVRARALRPASATTGFALLAVALASGATALAASSAGWQQKPGFAQLWLVPAAGGATLGVRSDYQGTRTFHLELRRGNSRAQRWTLSLAPGQTWQRAVTAANGTSLTARLATPDRTLTVRAVS